MSKDKKKATGGPIDPNIPLYDRDVGEVFIPGKVLIRVPYFQITVYANTETESRAAADAFMARIKEWMNARVK